MKPPPPPPREPHYWLEVREADAVDLASGYVPLTVRATVLGLLDAHEDDRRRAVRPLRKKGPR